MSFPRYLNYKNSKVVWLGKVPSHWKIDRMKYSITSTRNGIWGNESKGDENDIPCVRVADFDRQKLRVVLNDPTIRNVSETERTRRLLSKGNLLLEKSGGGDNQPVGCVVLYDDERPAICSNFIAKIELAKGMCSSFWRYVHAAAYSIRLTTGCINQTSGIQNLDQERYFNEFVVFPPESEQETIATFLDLETDKIDCLIEEQEKLILLLKEKRSSIISHAVTKGIDQTTPMKDSGIRYLGEVPIHWMLNKLSTISTKITNGYVGPTRGILVNEGVRYLQSLHIKNNRILFKNDYFVRREWSDKHEKSILQAGDVLIVQTGDIGQVALVTEEFSGCNCHALIIVSPKKEVITGGWIALALNSDYGFHSLLSIQTGALHPHLNCGNVRDVFIPIPPISEQLSILEYIDSETSKIDKLILEAKQAVELLKERRTALITAAVTGKIDVRGLVNQEVTV